MSRTITVSTDVYAAIWARRKQGQETEDAILRDVLECPAAEGGSAALPAANGSGGVYDARNGSGGVYDARNDVRFPQGFRAFRTYKRREYEAVAQDGEWLRPDTGKRYPTLNRLNESIAAGNENIWNGNWKYRGDDGTIRPIGDLRR